jgi:hypothetical protein
MFAHLLAGTTKPWSISQSEAGAGLGEEERNRMGKKRLDTKRTREALRPGLGAAGKMSICLNSRIELAKSAMEVTIYPA